MEDQTGKRLDRLEVAFETFRIEVNARFDVIDERFLRVEGRLDGIDKRLDRMDGRLDRVDHRLDSVQRTMTQGFIALTVGMLFGFTALGGLIVALG